MFSYNSTETSLCSDFVTSYGYDSEEIPPNSVLQLKTILIMIISENLRLTQCDLPMESRKTNRDNWKPEQNK